MRALHSHCSEFGFKVDDEFCDLSELSQIDAAVCQCQMEINMDSAGFNLKQSNSIYQDNVLGANIEDSLDTDSLPTEGDRNRRVKAQNNPLVSKTISTNKIDLSCIFKYISTSNIQIHFSYFICEWKLWGIA